MAKLGKYVAIKTGKLDANAAIENGKYPFFTCSVTPLRIDDFSYDCECVLVAGNGDLNVKYYYGKFDAYQRTYIIESNDKTLLTVPYLYFFLEKYIETLRKQSFGGIIKYIRLCNLTNAEIPLCGINKQNQITTVLSKLNSVIEMRKKQLLKLDELVKSRFIEMFGDPVINPFSWNTKKLLDMGYCKNGMNYHTGDYGVKINCLGVGDFKDLFIIDNTEQLPYISLNEIPADECMLKDEDIVFVRSNGNKELVGRCLVVYPKNTPTTYSGFCIRYRKTSDDVNTIYLLYVLKCESIRKQMLGRGANIQNLNQQILSNLIVPIPPIELQEQFSNFAKQIDKSK